MKLVIISDTHRAEPKLPSGDVLIHCGDLTYHGRLNETIQQLNYIASRSHHHKLVIPGNHELGWEYQGVRRWIAEAYPAITFLFDSGIEIDGVKFWGSPVQPYFHGWAFQKQRGAELKAHWEKIPEGIDVLITHGPPKGILDTNPKDERFGDEDLLNRVMVVRPQLHCFGHAHHSHGEKNIDGVKFINAAIMTEEYLPYNPPTEVTVEPRAGKH